MISGLKFRRNIEIWEAVRFPVERKENDQESIYESSPGLLIWEAERIRFQNADI